MYATSFDHGSISYGGGDSNASFEMRSRDNPTHLDSVDRFVRFIKFFRREVRLEDVASLDADLASNISSKPQEYLTLFEKAARAYLAKIVDKNENEVPKIQIILGSIGRKLGIRDLQSSAADHVSKLVQVPGIVISMSKSQAKATQLVIMCKTCNTKKIINVKPGFGGAELPRVCEGTIEQGDLKCGNNPFFILAEETVFIDQQVLKLQDNPEGVPAGEMPRHLDLIVDRNLVGKAVPGTRVTAMGILTIFRSSAREIGASNIRSTYLQVVGIKTDLEGRSAADFTASEVQQFQELSQSKNLYQKISSSIAPAIFGHSDIKSVLACQLFGGCRKSLSDGMKLRGDINALLLGDPGTAKSQLLKFIERVSPIAVYTSGKGSSAAGLTASVRREATTKEFYLEGGAMVLADGGIVCIDEFDKMKVSDRVAIHEAMEQQTISIAKAGITTVLNSRTAVLAAANPNFGTYDEMRSTSENFEEFRTTILSRFDCIFLIKDLRSAERDLQIAQHVMDVHRNAYRERDDTSNMAIPLLTLKHYVSYCRAVCEPRLSSYAAEILVNKYVSMRSQHRTREIEGNHKPTVVFKTYFDSQLEAIIRLSESLAKMTLSPIATEEHVEEALRLFNVSTVDAINSGHVVTEVMSEKMRSELEMIERTIKQRLAQNASMSEKRLVEAISLQFDIPENNIRRALQIMSSKGELEFQGKGKFVKRIL